MPISMIPLTRCYASVCGYAPTSHNGVILCGLFALLNITYIFLDTCFVYLFGCGQDKSDLGDNVYNPYNYHSIITLLYTFAGVGGR